MVLFLVFLWLTRFVCCVDSSHPRYAEQLKNSRGQQRENEKLG